MGTHVPVFLLSVALLSGFPHPGGTADLTALSQVDVTFCHGGLEVIYPEMSITKCLAIPAEFREPISTVWTAPKIRFSDADEMKSYVLMMLDPDAPSRSRPSRGHWRHWLVVDVKGSQLRNGNMDGNTLSEYARPTPPLKSGFHRYQFLLFQQPSDARLSLTAEEGSRGKWDSQAFIQRFSLEPPVAAVQFLTQNYKD